MRGVCCSGVRPVRVSRQGTLALVAAGLALGGCAAWSADYRAANATSSALFQSLHEVGLECPSPDRRSPVGETPILWDCDDSQGLGVLGCADQAECDEYMAGVLRGRAEGLTPKDFVFLTGDRWIIYGGPTDRGNVPLLEEIGSKVGGKLVIVPGSG